MMFDVLSIGKIILQLPSFSNVKSDLIPLAFMALLFDSVIIGIWYIAATLLQNQGAKESAKNEFYQFVGTIVMISIIIFVITTFGVIFYNGLNSTSLMDSSSIYALCNGIAAHSQLGILNPAHSVTSHSASLLVQSSSSSASFPGLCSLVNSPSSLTEMVDYPLAASGVIIANMTNQTANNMNSFFIYDAFLGFLETVSPTIMFCGNPAFLLCLGPLPTPIVFFLTVSFTPYKGISLIYKTLATLGSVLNLAFESFIVQLNFISIFIYAWPYLLFIGIIFRATVFTRKIGGLFIAIAIGVILFYPSVFAIEYLSLGNGIGSALTASSSSTISIASAYGFNSLLSESTTYIPSSVYNSISNSYNPYVVNFYDMPQIKYAGKANGCWPPGGNLISAEAEDIAYLFIPFSSIASMINAAASSVISTDPIKSFYLPSYCTPAAAADTLYTLMDEYGVISVSAYFLPIINILIVITGIIGLSGLLGGDTELAGLSRLV